MKLNSDSTRICILLVFLKVNSPRHIFLQLHIFMFFFLSIPPSFFAILSCFNSTLLSTMFVCIHVPPKNPINARAPSSTLFQRGAILEAHGRCQLLTSVHNRPFSISFPESPLPVLLDKGKANSGNKIEAF